MNTATERYLPMGLAAVVLIGCLLPFSGTANVFNWTTAMRGVASFIGGPFALVPYVMYLVPVMAAYLFVKGLGGPVAKGHQVSVGAGNLALCFLLQGAITAGVALPAGRMPPLFDLIKTDFDAGGWLIILASVGLILSGLGKIKVA